MVSVIKSVEEFEREVIGSEVPVIVDFFAEWCGPCKMFAPTFSKMSDEYKGEVKFIKVNVDDAQDLAVKYNVMSIPTTLFFKGGEVADQKTGALAEGMLKSWIDSLK